MDTKVWVYPEMQEGFTLIDLMAALALSSLLALIGISNSSELIDAYQRRTVKGSFSSDVLEARSVSLAQGAKGILSVSPDGASYQFGVDYLPYSSSLTPDKTIFTRNLPASIKVSPGMSITFNQQGYCVDTFGVPKEALLTFEQNGWTMSIARVPPLGPVVFE